MFFLTVTGDDFQLVDAMSVEIGVSRPRHYSRHALCAETPFLSSLTAKAMEYMLKRWSAFTRLLDDGRICLSNNAAE